MEYFLYSLLALLRGIFFPDLSSSLSIIVIHVLGPVCFALVGVAYAPQQRFRPKLLYFKKAATFLILAEVIALTIYAQGGGLPYLLGADHTPALVLTSILVQVSVFFGTVLAIAGLKYAPAP